MNLIGNLLDDESGGVSVDVALTLVLVVIASALAFRTLGGFMQQQAEAAAEAIGP